MLSEIDVRRANRLLLRSIRAIPTVKGAMGRAWRKGQLEPGPLLWANAARVASVGDLDDWIRTVDALTAKERATLFENNLADEGCWHMADAAWMAEADRAEGRRDWAGVDEGLRRLAEAGIRWITWSPRVPRTTGPGARRPPRSATRSATWPRS